LNELVSKKNLNVNDHDICWGIFATHDGWMQNECLRQTEKGETRNER